MRRAVSLVVVALLSTSCVGKEDDSLVLALAQIQANVDVGVSQMRFRELIAEAEAQRIFLEKRGKISNENNIEISLLVDLGKRIAGNWENDFTCKDAKFITKDKMVMIEDCDGGNDGLRKLLASLEVDERMITVIAGDNNKVAFPSVMVSASLTALAKRTANALKKL